MKLSGKDEPLSDYTETERKQFFRQKLLPIVQQMSPQHGIKVISHLYLLSSPSSKSYCYQTYNDLLQ